MSFIECRGKPRAAETRRAGRAGGAAASVEAVEPRVLMCSFTHLDVAAAAYAGYSGAGADVRERGAKPRPPSGSGRTSRWFCLDNS